MMMVSATGADSLSLLVHNKILKTGDWRLSVLLNCLFHLTSLLITSYPSSSTDRPPRSKDYHTREVSDSDYCLLDAGGGPRSRRVAVVQAWWEVGECNVAGPSQLYSCPVTANPDPGHWPSIQCVAGGHRHQHTGQPPHYHNHSHHQHSRQRRTVWRSRPGARSGEEREECCMITYYNFTSVTDTVPTIQFIVKYLTEAALDQVQLS